MLDSNVNRLELDLLEAQKRMQRIRAGVEPVRLQPDNIRIVLPKRKNNVGRK